MIVLHYNGEVKAKNESSFNSIFFKRISDNGLGAYLITDNADSITKIESPSFFNRKKPEFMSDSQHIHIFILNGEQFERAEKIINNTNEIVKLKYESIKYLRKYALSGINELYNKNNEGYNS